VPYYPYSPQHSAIYTLTSPSGVKAVFNDPFDADYVGMIQEISGLDSADIRESAEDLVEADGGVHGRFYHGRRPITINGKVFGHATQRERDIRLDKIRRASAALREDALLSWVPADAVDNLVSNPRFANGSTNYAAGITPGSSAVYTTPALSPTPLDLGFARQSVFTAAATSHQDILNYMPDAHTLADGSTFYPTAIAGMAHKYVSVSAYVRTTGFSSAPTVTLTARARDASNAYVGDVSLQARTVDTGDGWVLLSGTTPVSALPAGTVRVAPCVYLNAPGAGTATWWVAGVSSSFVSTPTVAPYIDGGLTDGYWFGEANKSPSGNYVPMEVQVRRQQPFRSPGGWVKDFQLQLVAENPQILSPWLRSTRVNIGDFITIDSLGNAAYYPKVDVYGGLNQQSVIEGGGGSVKLFTTGSPANGGALYGTLDTLKHTLWTASGFNVGEQINWAEVTEWPQVDPEGGMWTLQNGPVGTRTGGYIIVKSQDAWI
jgi:hypothetical protein